MNVARDTFYRFSNCADNVRDHRGEYVILAKNFLQRERRNTLAFFFKLNKIKQTSQFLFFIFNRTILSVWIFRKLNQIQTDITVIFFLCIEPLRIFHFFVPVQKLKWKNFIAPRRYAFEQSWRFPLLHHFYFFLLIVKVWLQINITNCLWNI